MNNCPECARLERENAALRKAAKLTVLHFQRNQVSGNFQGDDEHEVWTALNKALAITQSSEAARKEK